MTGHGLTWRNLARRTRRVTNFGWWLHGLGGPLVLVSLLAACGALWWRRLDPAAVALWMWPSVAIIVVGCGIWSWCRQRRHFITEQAAMVVLEVGYHLHNALTTASADRGPWPVPPPYPPPVRKWHWPNTLVPPFVAAALMVAGLLIPVPAPAVATMAEEPPAWKTMEEDLRQMVDKKVVDPKSAEETRKAIEQLRAGGKDEWYKHATLEATDRLQKKHQDSMRAMERELRRAGENAAPLGANAPALGPAQKARHEEQLQRALDGLRTAGLEPNAALKQQLEKLDPEQLGQLNRMQLDEMLDGLRQAAEALREQRQAEKKPGEGEEGEDGEGNGEGDGEGDPEEPRNGRGGPARGPGEGGNPLGQQGEELKAGGPKALQTRDFYQARPGDLLELKNSEHDVDPVSPGQQSGGGTESRGGGGAAWQDSLHPREQEALKKIFE
ncbi:MAG: hypothetical protein ACKO2G_12410 [Verrucomicrobiales bacterium]